LTENGHFWTGCDISKDMLEVAVSQEVLSETPISPTYTSQDVDINLECGDVYAFLSKIYALGTCGSMATYS